MLSDLCSYADIASRMKDPGLTTGSTEDSDAVEVIERKLIQAHAQIEFDLTVKVQKAIAPYQTDGYNNTPAQIVALITTEGKAFLKQCAVIYTIRAMLEEGESMFRFRFQEAGDTISSILKRWDKMCQIEFDKACTLVTFDQDGSGTVTLIERLLMNNFSSVRVTV